MKHLKICLSLFIIALTGCSAAQSGAISHAYQAVAENNCALAYKKLGAAESYSEPSPKLQSEISLLRAWCLEKEQRYDEALATYLYILDLGVTSDYSYRAKVRVKAIVNAFPELSEE